MLVVLYNLEGTLHKGNQDTYVANNSKQNPYLGLSLEEVLSGLAMCMFCRAKEEHVSNIFIPCPYSI